MKVVLPPATVSDHRNFSEPIIEAFRTIDHRQQEYCSGNIMFPLTNSDPFIPGKDTKMSNGHWEKEQRQLSKPIVEVIRIIGHRRQEYCFTNIIFPLINLRLSTPGKDTKVEQWPQGKKARPFSTGLVTSKPSLLIEASAMRPQRY